jgi:hypothetical protein
MVSDFVVVRFRPEFFRWAGGTPALQSAQSRFRVEEAPGEGSDFVEELDGGGGLCAVDGVGSGEETKMGVDLLR